MDQEKSSLKPIKGANRALRDRLDLKGELLPFAPPRLVALEKRGA